LIARATALAAGRATALAAGCALALAGGCALALSSGCGSASPGRALDVGAPRALPAPASSRVIEIVMENAERDEVVGSPNARYTNALIARYALATRSYAITHPSLPNYLALLSGSTHGIESDCTGCHVRAANLVDQLEAAHVSWKAYLEDVPAPCFTGAQAGGYAKKHNPFIYFDDIAHVRARCRRLVGFGALASDIRHARLPSFVWITPNLCDDGHDCGVSGADAFLARTVPLLLAELGPHGFLLVTWDEGTSDRGCCAGAAHGGAVTTIVAGPDVRRGARSSAPIDHYGVLGTVEEALGLPPLARASSATSGRLGALFVRPPLADLSVASAGGRVALRRLSP
jgi:phosphatidylinositol-3-phosphatase